MIKSRIKLDVSATFTLNEQECRALDALVGYGTDSFLEGFYEKLGRHYMEPHENGIRTMFEKFRKAVSPALSEIDTARELLTQERKS